MTIFKNITKKSYENLLNNEMTKPNTFYYLTDTKETFLGNKKTEKLFIVENGFPEVGDVLINLSKIYYKPSTCEARAYHPNKYIILSYAQNIDEETSNAYVTVSEMKNYIKNNPSSGGGSSSFRIIQVDALPTENIDTSAIYVVPVEGMGESNYNEYTYINGQWELVGEDTKAVVEKELEQMQWEQ